MKKNQELTLRCTDLSDLGYGICHENGMTIFVANLLPEEIARIKIIKTTKSYCIGRIVELLQASDQRVEPLCPKAGICGGCTLQHLSRSAQLSYKQKQLESLFHHVNPDLNVLPVIASPAPYYYRNKAQFPIGVRDGKIVSGFYRPHSNDIVDIDQCAIQNPKINEIFGWIKNHLSLKQAENLRHVFIRFSEQSNQGQVVFIGRSDEDLKDLSTRLVKTFPDLVSVVFNRNERDDNVILSDEYEILYGQDWIEERCLGLKIRLHFKAFFQVNPKGMEILYSKALSLADLKPDDQVVELYSGTGTIGMLAARDAQEVIGVEINPEAAANAQENARINHIENIQFVCQDATKFVHSWHGNADVVLVDPPRKGMSAQGISDVADLHPQRVVYISCNPRTLARDLGLFQNKGYICHQIQPVDMFSQASGVECVALLEQTDRSCQEAAADD